MEFGVFDEGGVWSPLRPSICLCLSSQCWFQAEINIETVVQSMPFKVDCVPGNCLSVIVIAIAMKFLNNKTVKAKSTDRRQFNMKSTQCEWKVENLLQA